MAKRKSGETEGAEGLFVPPEGGGEQPSVHEPEPVVEKGESGQEYYLFPHESFYRDEDKAECLALDHAANDQPLPSKAAVLQYARTAPAGKYVLVKVVDELEVESPTQENIVRTNPRQKRPRGGE